MTIFTKLFPLLQQAERSILITDEIVYELYGKALASELRTKGVDLITYTFPPGEKSKTRQTKEAIEDAMLEAKIDRNGVVIALGGGVVTDLAGFVAATYCRGIRLINIPTTLMGMVDAAIGGKTAVNVSSGKNQIGAFYPAHHLIIEESLLQSLPQEEWQNGFAEVVKYGLIASRPLFESLEKGEYENLTATCIDIKQHIVHQDPYEKGPRRVLNFGHTFAHACEQVNDFRVKHGVAVAAGLLFESFLSYRLGYLQVNDLKRISSLLKSFSFPKVDATRLLETMLRDKKNKGGKIRCVVLEQIGKTHPFDGDYCTDVKESYLKEAYEYLYHSTL